jgi:hypothetical protein
MAFSVSAIVIEPYGQSYPEMTPTFSTPFGLTTTLNGAFVRFLIFNIVIEAIIMFFFLLIWKLQLNKRRIILSLCLANLVIYPLFFYGWPKTIVLLPTNLFNNFPLLLSFAYILVWEIIAIVLEILIIYLLNKKEIKFDKLIKITIPINLISFIFSFLSIIDILYSLKR